MSLVLKSLTLMDVLEKTDGFIAILSLILDKIIYQGVSALYSIFAAFAAMDFRTIFNQLDVFKNNVFIIIGVFMLFVVAFNLLSYLLNPDKTTDSGKGAAAIVKNIVVALIMIAMVQPAFDIIYRAQTAIVGDQIMERIILGQGGDKNISNNNYEAIGDSMAYTMWMAFFTKGNEGTMCNTSDGACDEISNWVAAGVHGEMSAWSFYDSALKDSDIHYHGIFSFIGGAFVFLMLLSFIIDIGVRAFKLMFYEAISPIAIMSYINPSTQSSFWNWLKAVGSTFIDLFIRIAAILLSIILISQAGGIFKETHAAGLTGLTGVLAYFFIIVAVLTFAKLVPSLIGDLFNVKVGGTSLNPFKNAAFGAGVGGILGGAIGTVGGGIAGAATRGPLGALTGAMSGGARGMKNGFQNKGKVMKSGADATAAVKNKGAKLNRGGNQRLFAGVFGKNGGGLGALKGNIGSKVGYHKSQVAGKMDDTFGSSPGFLKNRASQNSANTRVKKRIDELKEYREKEANKQFGVGNRNEFLDHFVETRMKELGPISAEEAVIKRAEAAKLAGDMYDDQSWNILNNKLNENDPKATYIMEQLKKDIEESGHSPLEYSDGASLKDSVKDMGDQIDKEIFEYQKSDEGRNPEKK